MDGWYEVKIRINKIYFEISRIPFLSICLCVTCCILLAISYRRFIQKRNPQGEYFFLFLFIDKKRLMAI